MLQGQFRGHVEIGGTRVLDIENGSATTAGSSLVFRGVVSLSILNGTRTLACLSDVVSVASDGLSRADEIVIVAHEPSSLSYIRVWPTY